MKHIKVFRLEYMGHRQEAHNKGPYSTNIHVVERVVSLHALSGNAHPLPNEDRIHCELMSYHHFAFDSMEKLKAWFYPDFLQALQELGFKIYCLTLGKNDVVLGRQQCIFDSRHVISKTEFEA